MFLNLNSVQTRAFYFKEQILSSLTLQQKKILVIATVALSSIAAICLFYTCFFKAKEKDQQSLNAADQKADAQKEKIVIQQKQEPQPEQKTEQAKIEEPVGEPKTEQPKEGNEVEPEAKAEQSETIPEVEQKEELPKEEIERVPPKDEKVRNILIEGQRRTGKTTVLNVLGNIFHAAKKTSFFAKTKEPKLRESELSGYKFRALETPGHYSKGDVSTNIQRIKDHVKKHFGGKSFENLDAVIFTFRADTGFQSGDLEQLRELIPQLPVKTKKIILLTRAEILGDATRAKLVRELSNIFVIQKHAVTILFSGSLEKANFDDAGKINMAERICAIKLENIYEDTERLRKELLPVDEPKDLQGARRAEIANKLQAFFDHHYPVATDQPKEEASTIAEPTVEQPKQETKAEPTSDSETEQDVNDVNKEPEEQQHFTKISTEFLEKVNKGEYQAPPQFVEMLNRAAKKEEK